MEKEVLKRRRESEKRQALIHVLAFTLFLLFIVAVGLGGFTLGVMYANGKFASISQEEEGTPLVVWEDGFPYIDVSRYN